MLLKTISSKKDTVRNALCLLTVQLIVIIQDNKPLQRCPTIQTHIGTGLRHCHKGRGVRLQNEDLYRKSSTDTTQHVSILKLHHLRALDSLVCYTKVDKRGGHMRCKCNKLRQVRLQTLTLTSQH